MNQNRLLDVEFIQTKIDEGYQYTEETKGRDLVLVIGNTGVGKSTTCNYLLGYRMKEVKYNGRFVIETVEKTPIKIGHSVKAETLYAQSFVIHEKSSLTTGKSHGDICLLDCPGFLGNRTVEEQVIESVSTELAIRNARQIKGILILISYNVLNETRVRELRELVKTLISLFKNPVEMVQYSLFIITKKHRLIPDDEAKELTIGALISLKEYCEEQATKFHDNPNLSSSEDLTAVDYDRISVYFAAVLEKTDNIILINPLDKAESRNVILEKINNIKPRFAESQLSWAKKAVGIASEPPIRPITIDDFSFSEKNEARNKFNTALYERTDLGLYLIRKVKGCYKTYRTLNSEILNLQTALSKLGKPPDFEEEISKTGDGKCHRSKNSPELIRQLESVIPDYDKQIECMKSENAEKRTLREKLEEELKSIDTDVPFPFFHDGICKDVSLWKPFGWEEMKFEVDTGNKEVKIIKVKKEKKNGSWLDKVKQKQNGIYRIKYQSNYLARPAEATVTAYIQTRDENGNRRRIRINNEICRQLIEEERKLESNIAKYVSKIQSIQSTVARSKRNIESKRSKVIEDDENNLERVLPEFETQMHEIKAEILEKEEQRKEAKLTGMETLREFQCNRRKFDIIISIESLLEFPSAIIIIFVTEYKEFLSCIDNCISTFNESTVESLPYADEKDVKVKKKSSLSERTP